MADTIFDDNTLYANDKLGMVNTCLIAINQRPLPAGTILDELPIGSDGQVAKDIVSSVMREVQNRGWYFNTDKDFVFLPDSLGLIAVPDTLLRLDVGRTMNRGNIIVKGNKFYNKVTRDFQFDAPVTGDVVWLVDYSELPVTAYQYIALRASRIFQQNVVGNKDLYAFTTQNELDALNNLQREELQYGDYNMMEQRVVNRFFNPTWGQ